MKKLWALLAVVAMVFASANVSAEITEMAYFEQVKALYFKGAVDIKSGDVLKVYCGDNVTFRLMFRYTVPPPRSSTIDLVMEIDGLACKLASIAGTAEGSVTMYNVTKFDEPGVHKVAFKLYMDDVLYDLRTFNVFAVLLSASLTAKPVSLVRGLNAPNNISLILINLGNDYMYNISVTPPKGLFTFRSATPELVNELVPNGSCVFTYSVVANEIAPAGSNTCLIKAVYHDFLGREFTQSFPIEIFVEKQNLTIVPLNGSAPSVKANETFVLFFKVLDMEERPVEGARLGLYLNGSLLAAATSQSSGIAGFSNLEFSGPGGYFLVVSYDGEQFNTAKLNVTLMVSSHAEASLLGSYATTSLIIIMAAFIVYLALRKIKRPPEYYW